jgi:hypothetical protein
MRNGFPIHSFTSRNSPSSRQAPLTILNSSRIKLRAKAFRSMASIQIWLCSSSLRTSRARWWLSLSHSWRRAVLQVEITTGQTRTRSSNNSSSINSAHISLKEEALHPTVGLMSRKASTRPRLLYRIRHCRSQTRSRVVN